MKLLEQLETTLRGRKYAAATVKAYTGTDLRTIQKLLGHADIKTTMIYTHVDPSGLAEAKSPLALVLRAGGKSKPSIRAIG